MEFSNLWSSCSSGDDDVHFISSEGVPAAQNEVVISTEPIVLSSDSEFEESAMTNHSESTLGSQLFVLLE